MLGVYKSHNSSQGAALKNFYKDHSISIGDSYAVKVINTPPLNQRPKTLPEN